jgi:hypothetical protein
VLFLCPKIEKGGKVNGMEDTLVTSEAGKQVGQDIVQLL